MTVLVREVHEEAGRARERTPDRGSPFAAARDRAAKVEQVPDDRTIPDDPDSSGLLDGVEHRAVGRIRNEADRDCSPETKGASEGRQPIATRRWRSAARAAPMERLSPVRYDPFVSQAQWPDCRAPSSSCHCSPQQPAVAATIVTALLSPTIRVRRHRDRPRTFRLDAGRASDASVLQFAAYLDGNRRCWTAWFAARKHRRSRMQRTAAVDDPRPSHARGCSLLPVRRHRRRRAALGAAALQVAGVTPRTNRHRQARCRTRGRSGRRVGRHDAGCRDPRPIF